MSSKIVCYTFYLMSYQDRSGKSNGPVPSEISPQQREFLLSSHRTLVHDALIRTTDIQYDSNNNIFRLVAADGQPLLGLSVRPLQTRDGFDATLSFVGGGGQERQRSYSLKYRRNPMDPTSPAYIQEALRIEGTAENGPYIDARVLPQRAVDFSASQRQTLATSEVLAARLAQILASAPPESQRRMPTTRATLRQLEDAYSTIQYARDALTLGYPPSQAEIPYMLPRAGVPLVLHAHQKGNETHNLIGFDQHQGIFISDPPRAGTIIISPDGAIATEGYFQLPQNDPGFDPRRHFGVPPETYAVIQSHVLFDEVTRRARSLIAPDGRVTDPATLGIYERMSGILLRAGVRNTH